MAKKVVATLKDKDAKSYTKVIKAIKSKNGGYTFREEMVPMEMAKEALKK
jgi:hypothetical protein